MRVLFWILVLIALGASTIDLSGKGYSDMATKAEREQEQKLRYFCKHTGIPYSEWSKMNRDERTIFSRKFPSVTWIPNRAQQRAAEVWTQQPYPRVHVITYGNGTGKTDFLAEMLCGITKGSVWVNQKYMKLDFFEELSEKRKKGVLTVWWVCDGDLMKQNGPDYKAIKAHIPDAVFKGKTNSGVYSEIHVPAVGEDGKKTVIVVVQVKTHGEDTGSYAGENVDVIICDEPPPEQHWSEMVGRLRSKTGEVGARVIIGGTPLKISGFLFDLIEDREFAGRVKHSEGSLWENCDGKSLPESEAKRLNIPLDEDTGFYDTRGHITLESIQDQIMLWRKSKDPDELASRVDGKFTHVAGRIYKNFNQEVHVIKPYKIPSKYPVIQVVDPHDSRPDVAGWYAVTPRNKLICIGEYPNRPFEMCTSRSETIPDTCDTWRMMEEQMGISGQVVLRYGDPNKMSDPDPYTGKILSQLYAEHDFFFNLQVNDKIEYGHEMVRQFLSYDKGMFELYNGDPLYQPRLLFFDTCHNHINYVTKYATKTSKDPGRVLVTPDDKWKDFCDLIRYAVVTFKPFEVLSTMGKSSSEWESIKKARNPYTSDTDIYKGRRVVPVSGLFK
jgi:hypothetical protein